jgi:hypothetical protein
MNNLLSPNGAVHVAWDRLHQQRAARRGYLIARAARGARWTTIRFLKLYGDFRSLFMVKNGSETPRHGKPWELGDG